MTLHQEAKEALTGAWGRSSTWSQSRPVLGSLGTSEGWVEGPPSPVWAPQPYSMHRPRPVPKAVAEGCTPAGQQTQMAGLRCSSSADPREQGENPEALWGGSYCQELLPRATSRSFLLLWTTPKALVVAGRLKS